jgi:hypothetical protein
LRNKSIYVHKSRVSFNKKATYRTGLRGRWNLLSLSPE